MQYDRQEVDVKFVLEFSEVNNRIMRVDAVPGQEGLSPDSPGLYELKLRTALPSMVELCFSGKKQNLDTEIDSAGNIRKDLCVKIKKIALDNIDVDWFVVNKVMWFETESNQKFCTDYIGFNGKLTLHMEKDNVFDQIMTWKRLYGV